MTKDTAGTGASIGARLAKGSIWLSAARVLVNLSGLLSTVVLARLLVPADFGLVAIAATLMQIVTSVTELSLSQALIRLDDPTDDDFHSAWTLSVLRGVVVAVVLAASSPLVARFYGDDRLMPIMIVLGGAAMLSGFTNPWLATFQRRLVFWQDFVVSTASKLANVVVAVATAWYFQSYWAIVAGVVAMYATTVIVSYCVLPRFPRFSVGRARTLLSFSAWTSASQLVNALNWRFDQLLVGKIASPTVTGYYNVGFNLANLATREPTLPLLQTLFPAFAAIKHDPVRLAAAYVRADTLLLALSLPVGVGFALVAEPLVELMLGAKWLPAVYIMQAFAVIFGLQGLAGLVSALGMATGRVRELFLRDVKVLAVRLPLLVAGAVWLGIPGLVAARVLTGLYQVWIAMTMATRITGVGVWRQLVPHLPTFLGCAMMAGAVLLVGGRGWHPIHAYPLVQELVLRIAVGGMAYVVTRFAVWYLRGRGPGIEKDIVAIIARVRGRRAA